MKFYPKEFGSRTNYQAYLNCISKMKLGDKADLYVVRFATGTVAFSAAQTPITIHGTLVGIARAGTETTALLFGFGADARSNGWELNRAPSYYGFENQLDRWIDYPIVWQVNLYDSIREITEARIARIYRQL